MWTLEQQAATGQVLDLGIKMGQDGQVSSRRGLPRAPRTPGTGETEAARGRVNAFDNLQK